VYSFNEVPELQLISLRLRKVPYGGYLMSLACSTVYRFFEDRYPTLTQSDLITFHVEFLSKAVTGNATISIQPLKIGRQFSTVRLSVIQPNNAGNKYINCVEALVT
jgi:hypothetical protein